MNTKDNQEAARPTLEQFIAHAKVSFVHEAIIYGGGFVEHAIEIAEELQKLRATLTTPQVNEEVASVEVGTDESMEYLCETLVDNAMHAQTPIEMKGIIETALYHCRKHTTPSPSNVLVEALEVIANGKLIATGCRNVAKLALATYSASTDSVSVSRSEYEAMKADVERMNYICDDKNIYWIHIQTEPSGFDLFHSGRAPELREAIDTARKSS